MTRRGTATPLALAPCAHEGRYFCSNSAIGCNKGFTAWTQCTTRGCPATKDELVDRAPKIATAAPVDMAPPAPPPAHLAEVQGVYDGSDGDATSALYRRLEALGPIGAVAVNLFRAQKNSERAKSYRRRGSTAAAYGTKQWAMDNLCAALDEHAGILGLAWGWGEDVKQPVHRHVLYVELPDGQVSFHTDARGAGPDFAGQWDGVAGASPARIVAWVARLLDAVSPTS